MHIDVPEQQQLLVDLLTAEATARTRLHENRLPSNIQCVEDGDLVGLFGEWEGGRVFNVPVNLIRLAGMGDPGWDFVLPLRFTVDVKCFRKAYNLLVEQDKVVADIYVLAQFRDDPMGAELIGWEYGAALRRAPVRDFGYGKINHYIAAEQLRPIEQLLARQMHLR